MYQNSGYLPPELQQFIDALMQSGTGNNNIPVTQSLPPEPPMGQEPQAPRQIMTPPVAPLPNAPQQALGAMGGQPQPPSGPQYIPPQSTGGINPNAATTSAPPGGAPPQGRGGSTVSLLKALAPLLGGLAGGSFVGGGMAQSQMQYDAIRRQEEQRRIENQQAQQRIDLYKQEEKRRFEREEQQKMEEIVGQALKTGVPPEDISRVYGVSDPVKLDYLKTLYSKMQQRERENSVYFDVMTGKISLSQNPENPYQMLVPKSQLPTIIAAAKANRKFYVDQATGLMIPEDTPNLGEDIKAKMGPPLTLDEIKTKVSLNPQTSWSTKQIVDPKAPGGRKVVWEDPKGHKLYDYDTLAPIKGPVQFYTPPTMASQANVPMPLLQGADTIEARLAQVPANMQPMVKALIEYRRQPVGGFSTRDPFWKQALAYAQQVDPGYNEMEFPVRQRMMQNYTSGQPSSAGGQINAINTVLGHAGVLNDAVDALNNGNIKALNQIATAWKIQTGRDGPTVFSAIVNRVGPELTRAYVGTGGEQAEREINKSDFDRNLAPNLIKNNVSITVKLLRSKIGSLENQWKQTMQRDDFEKRFITPEAKRVIDQLAPGSILEGGNGPPVGTVEGGYRFKGGNPADPNSWEPVQR